jgi:SAM-dependent methyltransferase
VVLTALLIFVVASVVARASSRRQHPVDWYRPSRDDSPRSGGPTMSDRLYDVWWTDGHDGEQTMEESHHRHWQKLIDAIVEPDLRPCAVLDFGCNQGGFLRYLYGQRPFDSGVGVDLARKSVEVATTRVGSLPITYVATPTLEAFASRFDLAVSSAVVYLIADLAAHAREIKHALKPGGVYYATYSDYRGNPSLPSMREQINRHGAVAMQAHVLDDVALAFQHEGFEVGIRRMLPSGFIPARLPDRFFRGLADRMLYEYEQAYVFRCVAPA